MSAREVIARALLDLSPGVAPFEDQFPSVQRKRRDEADAILAALREADEATRLALIRDLMPEPTPAMVLAALDRKYSEECMYRSIWRAMLAAKEDQR